MSPALIYFFSLVNRAHKKALAKAKSMEHFHATLENLGYSRQE